VCRQEPRVRTSVAVTVIAVSAVTAGSAELNLGRSSRPFRPDQRHAAAAWLSLVRSAYSAFRYINRRKNWAALGLPAPPGTASTASRRQHRRCCPGPRPGCAAEHIGRHRHRGGEQVHPLQPRGQQRGEQHGRNRHGAGAADGLAR